LDTLSHAEAALVAEMRSLIDSARQRLVDRVTTELTQTYWLMGQRLLAEMIHNGEPKDGAALLAILSAQLARDYGRSFDARNLLRLVQFAEYFPNESVVTALRQHLGWGHFKQLVAIDNPFRRDFYAEMCRIERWSSRELERQIEARLFERTAQAAQPERFIQQEIDATVAQDSTCLSATGALRDPYVLDFLGMEDPHLDNGLEAAILREIEQFLLRLGAGFTLVARQKRVQVDQTDHYIDLVLYNRKLRRLVAIDLRLGGLHARYKSRMELYLRWLAQHEQEPGEASPLGITWCTGKTREHIEVLELDHHGVHRAEYLKVLPPRAELEAHLHQSVQLARERMLQLHGRPAVAH